METNFDKKYFGGVDIGKFIAAILVISLHTVPLVDYEGTYIYSVWKIIAELAVPFFFICTGFFIGLKTEGGNHAYIKQRALSFFKIYTLLTVAYLPLTIYGYVTDGKSFVVDVVYFVRGFFLFGNHLWSWQLWYLLCAAYSLLAIYLMLSAGIDDRIIWTVAIALYAFGILVNYTLGIGQNVVPGALFVANIVKKVCWNGRMFTGLLSLWIGINLKKIRQINQGILLSVFAVALITCVFVNGFLIAALRPILVTIAVLCLANWNADKSIKKYHFAEVSTYVYYIHMYLVFILSNIIKLKEGPRFLAVTVASVFFSYVYVVVRNGKRNK